LRLNAGSKFCVSFKARDLFIGAILTDLHIAGKEFDIPNKKVHVQEFDFEDVEARFIQALGYTVLDGVSQAQALYYITKTTFVISVGEGSIGELSHMGVVPALIVMSRLGILGTRT
jgi:hypothetical protein